MTKMKTKMKTTLLLLLFLVAHADASGETDLKCSQRTEAELWKDVTLYCYCEPRCDVTGEELKWKFNQKTFVLSYVGTSDAKYQDAQFKGRAQVSSTERLKDGNFPVTISKVIKSDEGTYTCHVGRKTCSVELKVKKEDKQASGARDDDTTTGTDGAQGDNIPTSDGPDPDTIIAIVAVVLVLVAAFAAWLICSNGKSLLSSKGRQRGGKEN